MKREQHDKDIVDILSQKEVRQLVLESDEGS